MLRNDVLAKLLIRYQDMRTPGILNKKEDGSFEYQIINEWQLCPKCLGDGLVFMYSTTAKSMCDLCNGKKIISKVNGLPPGNETTDGGVG